MAPRKTTRFVGTIAGLVPGVRTDGGLRLTNGALTDFVDLTVRVPVTVSVAATATLRNRGSAAALLEEIVFNENGAERANVYGPVLRAINEANVRSALTSKRVTTLADGTVPVGTYSLEETVRIPFAWLEQAIPEETSFAERNATAALSVVVRTVTDWAKALFNANGATIAFGAMTINVAQRYALKGNAPLFIQNIRSEIIPVNGVVTQTPVYIRSPHRIRAMVISQEVELAAGGRVEVSDVIDFLALRGDSQFDIGPEPMPFGDLVREAEYEFGGFVNTPAHLVKSFMTRGLLSNLLNTNEDTNYRTVITGKPSATAGQSQIRLTYVEMMEVPGVTVPADVRPFN